MTPDDLRQWAVSPYAGPQQSILAAADAWERDREELERERLRLAACGVAAMANTDKTVADRITPENPYYSASYEGVCDAVDREMALRKQVEELEALVSEALDDPRGPFKDGWQDRARHALEARE